MQMSRAETRSEGPPAVGETLKTLRQSQRLSLDDLSRRAGVSKSMLSQIERNEANPTVAILWRLASALGIDITDFLSNGQTKAAAAAVTVTAAHEMPTIKSADGKCELRILSPINMAGTVEWYQLTITAGGVLASEPHEKGAKEHLSVQSGAMTVRAGDSEVIVRSGDTARYPVDLQHSIANQGKTAATALLVVEYGR
ncbi:helix-turn-helix domain-containing protein [Polaromonas sp. LjRoot131]|uniref:helix-turn-helix domain-containing protein n=1 Tax=Polaromonas sp. LjRoot131 TaxID=3342262 RepID=UPI003ECC5517